MKRGRKEGRKEVGKTEGKQQQNNKKICLLIVYITDNVHLQPSSMLQLELEVSPFLCLLFLSQQQLLSPLTKGEKISARLYHMKTTRPTN